MACFGSKYTAQGRKVDSHGRRDCEFAYKGPMLGSVVTQQFKRHLALQTGALAGAEFFDLYKAPREEHPTGGVPLGLGPVRRTRRTS